MTVGAAAFRDACRRLEALAADDLGPEGLSHLAEQVVCFLGWSVLHGDPRRPAFQRQNDLVTRWGGPNADNVYRHARVDSRRRYRIRGRMHGCEDFILAVRAGFMHMDTWGTLHQVTASDLGIREGDDFELLVGGDASGAIPLPDGAAMVSIREYYFDWRPLEPATFTIECLDGDSPDAPPTDEMVARRMQDGIEHIQASMRYWDDYLVQARARQDDNSFTASLQVAKGLAAARYAYCFWKLGPDEALCVESDVPQSRYWSFELYNLRWFEAFDLDDRVTSRNHRQALIDSDGRVRVVVAHDDPGAANWLDTGDRPEGLLMLRWFWPQGEEAPSPSAEVVPFSTVRDRLPADTPLVEPAVRRAERQRRIEHLAWRFRT